MIIGRFGRVNVSLGIDNLYHLTDSPFFIFYFFCPFAILISNCCKLFLK